MNFKLLTSKGIDFILNLAVVSLGIGIFEKNFLGLFIGLFGVLIALVIILRTKE